MSFDLSKVLAQANKVQADAQESGGGFKDKLIYPQVGTLKIKLLFNPKSQMVIRKFERHNVGDNKVPCLTQYGTDCPICKILSDIENAKGIDLWKYKRSTRGICYAEYISDTYKWDKPDYKPNPGDIVMVMFPWTIYQDLNRIMSSAGPNLAQVVASNVGSVVNIERYVQGGQTKYSASIDAFNMNHQTKPTDQEYNDLLMGLDDLNEKFVPVSANDDILSKAKEVAESLSREYLNTPVTQSNVGNAGMTFGGLGTQQTPPPSVPQNNYYKDPNTGIEYDLINNQWVPRINQVPTPPPVPQQSTSSQVDNQSVTTNSISNNPSCFGKHGSTDANQCLVCFKEAECAASSKS